MAITAAMVKELREMTGAGMMECKKALTEANGDFDEAVKVLRERGLAAAQKKATRIARSMVTEYGMSKLGPMMLEEPSGNTFLGRDYTKNRNISDIVAHEIDEEMRSIINECYEKTKKILTKNKDLLDLIANTLLEEETITKEQIDYLVEHGHLPKNDEKDTSEESKETSKENKISE